MQINTASSLEEALNKIVADLQRGAGDIRWADHSAQQAIRSGFLAVNALAAVVSELTRLGSEPALQIHGVLRHELGVAE